MKQFFLKVFPTSTTAGFYCIYIFIKLYFDNDLTNFINSVRNNTYIIIFSMMFCMCLVNKIM